MEEYYKLGEIFRSSDIKRNISENKHSVKDIINAKMLISNSKSINDIKRLREVRKKDSMYDTLKKHYKINQEEELI